MQTIPFAEISRRLRETPCPPVEAVVGILTGGLVPAALLAHQWQLPLYWLALNFRDPHNDPQHPAPLQIAPTSLPPPHVPVVVIDDVSVSGATVDVARQILAPRPVTTIVLKGRGDIVLFPEVQGCVHWPWKWPPQ